MRARRPLPTAVAPDAPICALNTTPLIDVMLVLLIMFILSVPLATHAVKIDLPPDGLDLEEPQTHRLAIDRAGRLFWDGAPITEASLSERLRAFRFVRPDGLLEMQSEAETRYEAFDRVLATVKRSGPERLAFVGNERFARAIE